MAAPHVTGVVALYAGEEPGSDFVAIRKQIQQRGRPSTRWPRCRIMIGVTAKSTPCNR